MVFGAQRVNETVPRSREKLKRRQKEGAKHTASFVWSKSTHLTAAKEIFSYSGEDRASVITRSPRFAEIQCGRRTENRMKT